MRILNDWFSSRYSHNSGGGMNCVALKAEGGVVSMRDSKLGEKSPVLDFTPHEWDAFIKGVKDGEFDLPPEMEAQITDPAHGGGPLVNPDEFDGHFGPD